MKILLTDDSQFMRTILKAIVVKAFADATFIEANNGKDTVTLTHEQDPDLLLLDLVMPEKGGIDVLKEVGTAKKGRIIVISALGQEKVMQEALGLGAAAFIIKPFDEKQVLDTLKKVAGS